MTIKGSDKVLQGMKNKTNPIWFRQEAVDSLLFDSSMMTMNDPDQVLASAGIPREALETLMYNPMVRSPINARTEAVMAKLFKVSKASEETDTEQNIRLLKLSGHGLTHDFLYEQINPYLRDLFYGMLKARWYGYSVFELQYNEPKSVYAPLTIKTIDEKPFKWFEPLNYQVPIYKGHSNLKYILEAQDDFVDTTNKFLLVRNQPTYENPYGEALLSLAYWLYYFNKQNNMFWLKFLEVSANQRLVGKSDNPEAMVVQIRKIIQDAATAISREDDLYAISNAGNGESFEKFANFIKKEVWEIYTGRAPLSSLSSGSRAAQESENEATFQNYVDSDVNFCIDYLTKLTQIIMNANSGRLHGHYEWYYDAEIGLHSERAERDKILMDANPNFTLTESYYKEKYGLNESDFVIKEEAEPTDTDSLFGQKMSLDKPSMPAKFANGDNELDLQAIFDEQEFDADTELIAEQVLEFLTEERDKIIAALDKDDDASATIDDMQSKNEALLLLLYIQQSVKYGLELNPNLSPSEQEELAIQIKEFIESEGVSAIDVSVIQDNTKKKVADLIEQSQAEDMVEPLTAVLATSAVFSGERAKVIADVLNNRSKNMGDYVAAKQQGFTKKRWVSKRDKRVREPHTKNDRRGYIGIDKLWTAGENPMRFPLDHRGSASDIIGCRCRVEYS